MLKKYKIVSIGENDEYYEDNKELIGREILAESNDVGRIYSCALSGEVVFHFNLEDSKDVWCKGDYCFHEAYVEEF